MTRTCLSAKVATCVGLLLTFGASFAIADEDVIGSITRETIREGRSGGTSWFHPRATVIASAAQPTVLMTLQPIMGSDYYGPVHWSQTTDGGRHWSEPVEIPGLGRKTLADGSQEGVCDVVPEFHPHTNTVLAMGHNVYYRNGKLQTPQGPRWPVYVVRRADGTWSDPQRLEWDDPRGKLIYTSNCSQRVTLPSGDLLIPITYGADAKQARSVSTLLCSFDGKTVRVKQVGNQLKNGVGRGLLEPSLVRFESKFFLTLRAEDNRGHVSQSNDGLEWEAQQPWTWDDGEPLTMSTTQQHWLAHSNALYLVYTRKAEENVNVFRWRSPLYIAQVDRQTLRLIRSTERVALPLIGDGIKAPKQVAYSGNFHPCAISADEALITDGEHFPGNNYHGDLLQARIRWTNPDRLMKPQAQ